MDFYRLCMGDMVVSIFPIYRYCAFSLSLSFQILGIILFAVEIYWFIMLPIIREVNNWYKLDQNKT